MIGVSWVNTKELLADRSMSNRRSARSSVVIVPYPGAEVCPRHVVLSAGVGSSAIRASGAPVSVGYHRPAVGGDRSVVAGPVDAIFYLVDNGIKWRAMPVDFPPWSTVQNGIASSWPALHEFHAARWYSLITPASSCRRLERHDGGPRAAVPRRPPGCGARLRRCRWAAAGSRWPAGCRSRCRYGQLHRVRDVTYGEAASTARTGTGTGGTLAWVFDADLDLAVDCGQASGGDLHAGCRLGATARC
jgi:transposase